MSAAVSARGAALLAGLAVAAMPAAGAAAEVEHPQRAAELGAAPGREGVERRLDGGRAQPGRDARTAVSAALVENGVPVLGAVRRLEQLHTPSRHLGLIPAAERSGEALATVRGLGEVVGATTVSRSTTKTSVEPGGISGEGDCLP